MDKEFHFLEEDEQIRGQNWVLISFVEPKYDVLEKKETFMLTKYLEDKCNTYNNTNPMETKTKTVEEVKQEKLEKLAALLQNKEKLLLNFKEFKLCNKEELQQEFEVYIKGHNNIRGVKVRGVYNTIEEAKHKAQQLQKCDRSFHIFMAQVGRWLPFNPDPNDLEKQEYLETKLNDIVQKYEENRHQSKQFFEERKQEMIQEALSEKRKVASSKSTPMDGLEDNILTHSQLKSQKNEESVKEDNDKKNNDDNVHVI